jgi:hypothetical protein
MDIWLGAPPDSYREAIGGLGEWLKLRGRSAELKVQGLGYGGWNSKTENRELKGIRLRTQD